MRKLVAIVMLMLAPSFLCASLRASVNVNGNTSSCMTGAVNADLGAPIRPVTIAAWYNLTTTASDSQAMASPGSISLAPVDNGDCGSKVVAFVKLSSAAVCSSHVPSTGVWEFAAAVVNSGNTSVHFVFMTASGTVTTQDVANSSAINTGSGGPEAGSFNALCAVPLQGLIAQEAIWFGAGLSDKEIVAYARGGPLAVGRQATLYWPLFFPNAHNVNMGDYYPTAQNGHLRNHYINGPTTGLIGSTHCPCGDPF